VVTVTTLWADERVYYPLHAVPYTPAHHFARGRADVAFHTKPQLAADLVRQVLTLPISGAAVVAEGADGDNEEFRVELRRTGLAYVVALKPSKGTWAREWEPHPPLTPPGCCPGAARTIPGTGGRWSASCVTAIPSAGGSPTRPWLGPRSSLPVGGGHHRPGQVAGEDHLVSDHRPAPPWQPARGRLAPLGSRLRRDRPGLRSAHLGGTGLPTSQRSTRLGGLPGPLRCGDSPPPGAGVLRVFLLLASRAHRDAPRVWLCWCRSD
jgi:hypothetical protein